jgi:hypothetical protein
LNVSEQQAEPTSGEPGSVGTGPAVPPPSDAPGEPVAASAPEKVESPNLAPGQGVTGKVDAPKADAPEAEALKADGPKVDAPRADVPKGDPPKRETPKSEAANVDAPRLPGKIMIMSSGDNWDYEGPEPKAETEQAQGAPGKRRLSAMAAVVALATVAGALGGALATAGFGHFAGAAKAKSNDVVAEAAIARIDADLLALKASVEHTSKLGASQFNKTNDRLDKVEKAQAEPAAKLAKLSDAVDKLRASAAAPVPVAAAPAAAKEVTGSITPPATAAAPIPMPVPRPEVARLPTVDGWVLREVANGVALIEGRQGIFEVYAGDPVPGLGRVDAIRKQDGRWVVVTSRGLVVAR